jgi:hypothetical protein
MLEATVRPFRGANVDLDIKASALGFVGGRDVHWHKSVELIIGRRKPLKGSL